MENSEYYLLAFIFNLVDLFSDCNQCTNVRRPELHVLPLRERI